MESKIIRKDESLFPSSENCGKSLHIDFEELDSYG
jgi:hypothetical protein